MRGNGDARVLVVDPTERRDAATLEHFVDGYRKAGLPE